MSSDEQRNHVVKPPAAAEGNGEARFEVCGHDEVPALDRWHGLQQEWIAAKTAYEDSLRELDELVLQHLTADAPAPGKRLCDIRDDLLFRMSEARGALDQFIDEGCA